MAAGPLTVTTARKQVVDFTSPFMRSGIQALILNPTYVQHNPFRVIYPFTIEVWFLHLIVFGIVTLLLFLFNRYDPFEWKAVVEKTEVDEGHADDFSLFNSMWFCATTLFLQSYDSSPRSNAGRCITGFWWLYVLVMVFLYITNFSFFVNSNQRLRYIKDINDLTEQQTVKYGTVRGGNTYHYLKGHQRELWHKMNNDHADVYVNSLREGVERVRNSNGLYAFIGETPELTWIAKQKPCDTKVVGEYLARTQYAFAVAKDSPLADHISGAMETLRDSGVMADLESDWWHTDDRNNYCHNLTVFERSGAYSMTVYDLSGIYYLIIIGIGSSFLVFLLEFLYWNMCGGKYKRGGDTPRKAKKPKVEKGKGDYSPVDSSRTGGGKGPDDPNMWI